MVPSIKGAALFTPITPSMKKRFPTFSPFLFLLHLTGVSSIEAQENKADWVNLLQGDSLELWELGPSKAKSKKIGDRWSLKEGLLHLDRDAEKGRGGQIWTKKNYYDFELKFEFNIAHNGNSGIKYRAANVNDRALGCEYQIIDDDNYRDNKNPTHRTACLYELIAVPADRKWNPAGEWNTGRIRVSNNQFEHWLNGEKVVSIQFNSDDWKKRFADSKYRVYPEFAKKAGPIVLTDHSDTISYRNIYIRELASEPKPRQTSPTRTLDYHSEERAIADAAKASARFTEPAAFTTNCKACHLLDQALVGPSLVEVAELYPRKKRDQFIQWCLTPGHKREHLPPMPSMAHIPEDQLIEIYDYIKQVSVGVKKIRTSKGDPYATAPATTQRPRIVRTFVPEASPASLILALPTAQKHNIIWDTVHCRLRYITVGKVDNYPYLKSNGNSLAKVGDVIYRELEPIFSSQEIQYKGYRLNKEGYPSFLYQIGTTEVTESISVDGDTIIRSFQTTAKLPTHQLPDKGNDQLAVTSSQSDNSATISYTAK